MRLWLRNNSLSLAFGLTFLAALLGQSVAGHRVYNEEAVQHGSATISYARYLVSSSFGEAVVENWQSEYLQFTLFILATVWLVQRGSNESKAPEEAGRESDEQQLIGEHAQRNSPRWAKVGGWSTALYSNSLLLLMTAIFFASWFAQSATGWSEYNEQQRDHGAVTVSWAGYLARADFWEKTLQNWQSEFLAVGTMAVFTIYLRQRGSPESKPVGAPHNQTGTSG
jgi:membrane protein implicated in regulation of membrane protease activity